MKDFKQLRRLAAGFLSLLLLLSVSGCGAASKGQVEAAAASTAAGQVTAAPAEQETVQTADPGETAEAEPLPGDTAAASTEEPASGDETEASSEASRAEAGSAGEADSAAEKPRNTAGTAAAAETKPAASADTVSPLRKLVQSQVKGFSGTWSVYFKRLDTGECFAIHEKSMVAASLIKLYIYGAAAQQIEKGKLSADYYSSTMLPMISVSDNTAANTMIDAVGGMDTVNKFIKAQGWKQSQLSRKMLAPDPVENYTSVSECGDLLEQVYNGTYVSKTASKNLLDAMLSQTRKTKILAGLPSGTKCANKTGELSDVENDAAIVYSPACTYILVVMSDDIASGTAQSNIAALSKTVYDYLNP